MHEPLGQRPTVPLEKLATVDPESLPGSGNPRFRFKYIDISAAADGRLTIPSESMELSEAPSRARRILKSGDVIMSTVRPSLKAFAQCNFESGNYIASTGFAVLRARENADAYFLLCAILSDAVAGQIERFAVGSNYPAINSSDVRRLRLPSFSLRTQQKISGIFTSIDTAIEKTEALIEKYQQIKAGLMQDLFTRGVLPNGQLRPPRDQAPALYQETAIGWMPKEWKVENIDAVLSRIIDYRGKTPEKTVSGVPLVTAKHVRMGYVEAEPREFIAESDYSRWMTRGIPNRGDVLFTTEAPLGNVAQIRSVDRIAFAQRVIILQPSHQVRAGFLAYRLMSESTQNAIGRLASGSTALGIKQSEFRKVRIGFPLENGEQQQIELRFESLDGFIFGELENKEKLTRQKLGLMQDLLTGKVPVQVDHVNLEVAA